MLPTPAHGHLPRLREPDVDQRSDRRYPITLRIEYKLLSNGPGRCGAGKTLNVSSSGILFEITDALPVRSLIEIQMDWPYLKDGVCPVKLVMRGRVVRSSGKCGAMRADRYEFHIAGAVCGATS